jgi:hypothetical protein
VAVDPRFSQDGKFMRTRIEIPIRKKGKGNAKSTRENIDLPSGSYSSVKPGPTYGQMYVAPANEQFIDMRPAQQTGPLEVMSPDDLEGRGIVDEVGAQLGMGAEAVGGAVSDAAEAIGGFFSGLFGGSDEEGKQKAKQKMKAAMQSKSQAAPMTVTPGLTPYPQGIMK